MSKIDRAESIRLLNLAVNEELLSVHQYMYFHFRADDAGYDLLAEMFKRVAIQEMGHVERLAERILFLKGDVDMRVNGSIDRLEKPHDMLQKAVELETGTILDYNAWAQACSANLDAASKKLFEDLIVEEEIHQDQFDTEMTNLDQFGTSYLALQSIERSKAIATKNLDNVS